MCCVMPPASPATTSVERIASSSDVLPWSTWPMIVMTGGRYVRSSSASSKTGSASTSSAAWTISTCLSNSSARMPTASSDSVCVSVAIWPSIMSFLMISGTGTPIDSAMSLTVEPELIRTRSVCDAAASLSGATVSSYVPRRRRPRRWRRGGWDCWPGVRREACESMTTRRRPPGPAAPGVRSPASEERVGRCLAGSLPSAGAGGPAAGWPACRRRPARAARRRARACGGGLGARRGAGLAAGCWRSRWAAAARSEAAGGAGGARRTVGRGAAGAAGLASACAAAPFVGSGRPSSAAFAWSSSTADAGALTLMPALAQLVEHVLGGHVVGLGELVNADFCH